MKLWIQTGLPYHSYYLVLSKSKNLSPPLCCIFAEENLDHLPWSISHVLHVVDCSFVGLELVPLSKVTFVNLK